MKKIAVTTLILLSIALISACRKSSREIIWYGGNPDSVQIAITNVETIKDNDRDGDYYKDIFTVYNRRNAKFISVNEEATVDIGLVSSILYESTTAGERFTVTRRQKNVKYTLRTTWSIPGNGAPYIHTYEFSSTGE
ncbi:hypothetical protein DJ568_08775 [Mucilaginibacter hurinus]|uniref:Uncharacterized protein n=1 Tax=Mucilaginibacter hurinus TaxID=2201324 RepID=A0A367GQB6_9SPHI|nr:hypothetical protein [Mucilaginibacter hurinus]RCH55268.1 hypothetical protein DJ568_08775 [Mucilaginibacter hurinus]